MTFLFKVGRKKQKIELTNLEYEMAMAKTKKPFVEPMQKYLKELDEATSAVREKYKDFLEDYTETVSRETEEFVVKKINAYFSLEDDLGLMK